MITSNITKVRPSDPKDYSASLEIKSPNELASIRFGNTFYITEQPIYAVDKKTRKVTSNLQKFKLVKAV